MPNQDYKSLLTDVIKKQIAILGPQIVVEKVKNVSGIKIDDNGQVLEVTEDPQKIIQALIDQFVQLSGLIVKKTMEPLLTYQLDGAFKPEATANIPTAPINPMPTPPVPMPTSSMPPVNSAIPHPIVNPIAKPNPISHDLNNPISQNPSQTLNPNPMMNPMPAPAHAPINPMPSASPTAPTMPTMATSAPMPKPVMPTPLTSPTPANAATAANNPQIIEHKENSPVQLDEETQKIINSALDNK